MAIGNDFTVSLSGDIRRAAGASSTVYDVLALHAWLQDLADDLTPTGDDNVSMLSKNPSKPDGPRDALVATRLNLINGFNITDEEAKYINFGSIKQAGGTVLYSGLQTIGAVVANSPIYVVQNNTKLTKYWGNGHIRIMLKVRDAGSLIDSGFIDVYSRKFGQEYSYFRTNLAAGGEGSAALATKVDGNITLSLAQAQALSTKVTITVGAANLDLGNGNGSKAYAGTIALSGGCTLAEAYQYCMAITEEGSAVNIGGVPGWRFRGLAGMPENQAAPFGTRAGGKWLLAPGWALTGVLPAESQSYELVASDLSSQVPPNQIGISITNLVVGDSVIVGRDDGAGGIIANEYTLNGAHASGATSVVVNGTIASDIPASGVIIIGTKKLSYTARSGSTFTLSGTIGASFASGTAAFVPFIYKTAAATTESVSFLFNAPFTARVIVRNNSAVIQEYNATFQVGTAGGSSNVIRTSDQ